MICKTQNVDYIATDHTAEYCEFVGDICGYRINGLCRADNCNGATEAVNCCNGDACNLILPGGETDE